MRAIYYSGLHRDEYGCGLSGDGERIEGECPELKCD